MIPEEYINFGVVEIPSTKPCFRVWKNHHECTDIEVSNPPIDVYWSGKAIIGVFEDHKRIYHGLGNSDYQTIYL